MFITKVVIKRNAFVAHKLANANDNLHRLVWCMFPNDLKERPSVIYRIQKDVIYVISSIATIATQQVGEMFSSFQTKEFSPQFSKGMSLSFDLLANPVRTSEEGKRMALLDAESQKEWIVRQGQNFGFAVKTLDIGCYEKMFINRSPVFAVQFNGVLQVDDPIKFIVAVTNGIGKAKAYGLGMLMVTKLI